MIELSDEERAELERRVACYTLPHSVVVRAKMILYAAEGQSTVEIRLEDRERGPPRRFPPEQVAELKALAYELPATYGPPLSRFSRTELRRLVVERDNGSSHAGRASIERLEAPTRTCA